MEPRKTELEKRQELEKILDRIWENNRDTIKESDGGTYIDVDTLTIRKEGLTEGDIISPGGLSTWKNQPDRGRYFLEGFGRGRARLFRR